MKKWQNEISMEEVKKERKRAKEEIARKDKGEGSSSANDRR